MRTRVVLATLVAAAVLLGVLWRIYLATPNQEKRPEWSEYITVQKLESGQQVEGTWALNIPGGFYGVCLQLDNDGRFRYWVYSDVKSDHEIHYPLSGTYKIKRGKVVLDGPDELNEKHWLYGTHQGKTGLWRESALDSMYRLGRDPEDEMMVRVSKDAQPTKPVYNAKSR